MKLSVYVPKELEEPLKTKARAEGVSPSIYVQSVVRHDLETDSEWPEAFRELAGSWEDDRTAEEIMRDIEESRTSTERDEFL